MTPDRDTQPPSPVECSEALLRVFEYLDGEMGLEDQAKSGPTSTSAPSASGSTTSTRWSSVVKRSCAEVQAPVRLRSTILTRLTLIQIESTD